MLSSIPKGGAVRLPSSSSSSSSSRVARRSKRREARRTNPEKAWSIPSCEWRGCSLQRVSHCPVPTDDGGYYPLWSLVRARGKRERERCAQTVARERSREQSAAQTCGHRPGTHAGHTRDTQDTGLTQHPLFSAHSECGTHSNVLFLQSARVVALLVYSKTQ